MKVYNSNGTGGKVDVFKDEYERERFIGICKEAASDRMNENRPEDVGKTFEQLVSEIYDARLLYASEWLL